MSQDFASATMLRLLLRGMVARGLTPPLPVPDGARVAIQDKRRVVAAIVEQGGLATLLSLAQEIRHIQAEPLHQVLGAARDPLDFMRRWQRLERYVHASHRVLVETQASEQLTLRHCGPDPQPAESLAVLGVLIGGFGTVGTLNLQVRIGDRPVYPQAEEAALRTLASTGAMRLWQFRWQEASVSGRDRLGAPADLLAALDWPPVALALARRQLADPAAALQLAAVARSLGLSGRTLQRQLSAHGLSFGGVIAETRARQAARCLTDTDHSLAEIGFLCGFSDQAHFTREFTRRVGLPPARYRRAGAVAP